MSNLNQLIRPTLCIYHHNCADGFGAAFVVWMLFDNTVEYHPGQYGVEPPDCTGHDVLLVDFSYKLPQLERIIKQANSVTILDHHKTAEADIKPLLERGEVRGEFDMSRSGAAITWDWCFPGEARPALIEHIQDRDLWHFDLKGTREITAVLFSYEQDFVTWSNIRDELDYEAGWVEMYFTGAALLRKHDKDVESVISQAQRRMTIAGFNVPVVNAPYMFASDIGNLLSEGQPFAASYYDSPTGRKFSLRSKSNGLDVSLIAKNYGGGGHARAAGFEMPIGWEGE